MNRPLASEAAMGAIAAARFTLGRTLLWGLRQGTAEALQEMEPIVAGLADRELACVLDRYPLTDPQPCDGPSRTLTTDQAIARIKRLIHRVVGQAWEGPEACRHEVCAGLLRDEMTHLLRRWNAPAVTR